jgi:hypothetical protein
MDRVHALHLNDSKGGLGSHLDRHEHIGAGTIGLGGFKALFSDKRLWDLPVVLETPREHPQDELRDLWQAIDLAVEAGALKRHDAGDRPAESGETAASKGSLRVKSVASKPTEKKARKTASSKSKNRRNK